MMLKQPSMEWTNVVTSFLQPNVVIYSKMFRKRHRCLEHLFNLKRRIKQKTVQRSNLGEFVYVVAGVLSNDNEHCQWCYAGSAQNHTSGLSSVPCRHAAQDICQQKRHTPHPHRHHILPFMSHRETWGYFWGYSCVQDGCSFTDYSLEEDGKQRTWCGSCWLGCHSEKCLEKQYESPWYCVNTALILLILLLASCWS